MKGLFTADVRSVVGDYVAGVPELLLLLTGAPLVFVPCGSSLSSGGFDVSLSPKNIPL